MYGHERTLVSDYSGRPFVLLGVNNDTKISRVIKAKKENDLNWRSWYDGKGGPIVKSYGIRAFPTIFLIDHTGEIRAKNLRGKKLDEMISTLVEEAEGDVTRGLREFVDSTGKFKINAKLIGFESKNAILETQDGEETKVPWKRLSLEDKQFVAKFRLKEAGLDRILKRDLHFSFDKPMEFTDVTGKYTLRGTYIGLSDGESIIWAEDGTETRVSRKKLSEKTKDKIKAETKAQRKNRAE
ncbi:MAG: SHD1 domain-containing protein [Mariniblastus sp.]